MSGKSVLTWDQYEELLAPLTKELSDAARWVQETGQRLIIKSSRIPPFSASSSE